MTGCKLKYDSFITNKGTKQICLNNYTNRETFLPPQAIKAMVQGERTWYTNTSCFQSKLAWDSNPHTKFPSLYQAQPALMTILFFALFFYTLSLSCNWIYFWALKIISRTIHGTED